MTAAKPKLDIDATRERLSALDCGYAAEHLGHLLGEAVRTEIAPHSFLDQLLAVELSAREERRVKTSPKLSNLPTGQTLENFDFAFQPAIERSRIDTLASCVACVENPAGSTKARRLGPATAIATTAAAIVLRQWSRGSAYLSRTSDGWGTRQRHSRVPKESGGLFAGPAVRLRDLKRITTREACTCTPLLRKILAISNQRST